MSQPPPRTTILQKLHHDFLEYIYQHHIWCHPQLRRYTKHISLVARHLYLVISLQHKMFLIITMYPLHIPSEKPCQNGKVWSLSKLRSKAVNFTSVWWKGRFLRWWKGWSVYLNVYVYVNVYVNVNEELKCCCNQPQLIARWKEINLEKIYLWLVMKAGLPMIGQRLEWWKVL